MRIQVLARILRGVPGDDRIEFSIKTITLIVVTCLILVGLVVAETGSVPSSAEGWVLLIVLGPIGYLIAHALGELGMERLDGATKRLGLGPVRRIALGVVALACTALLASGIYWVFR